MYFVSKCTICTLKFCFYRHETQVVRIKIPIFASSTETFNVFNMFTKLILLIISLFVISPAEVSAQSSQINLGSSEFWAGYWNGDMDGRLIGMGVSSKARRYGAAICIPEGCKEAEGYTIEGIKVLFTYGRPIEDFCVFMSTKLPSEAEDADIDLVRCGKAAGVRDNRFRPCNEVRFDKPYAYDPSAPLYIGYTFTLNASEGFPLDGFPIVVDQVEERDNAMLLNYNGGKWYDYNGTGFGILAMQVLFSGDFPDNDVTMSPDLVSVSTTERNVVIPVEVKNRGVRGIGSLVVETDVNGVVTDHEVVPDDTIRGIGTPYRFSVEAATPQNTGMYRYGVRIKYINGEPVTSDIGGGGTLVVLSRIVPHRVLVEEFTSMDFGLAPLGLVAFEKLHNLYGDNVALVSAHVRDSIECLEYKDLVELPDSLCPLANVDRRILDVNPYGGSNRRMFGIKEDVEECMAVPAIAEVGVVPHLDGDILTARAEVKFLMSCDASDYALAYIITEDCMKDDEWLQSNEMAKDCGIPGFPVEDINDDNWEPMFEPWLDAPEFVPGVEYNHVAITARGIENGIPGSIPQKVREEVSVYHEEEFDLTNWSKIKHRDRLNVIVVLFDTNTGRVVNSCLTPLNKAVNGIEEVRSSTFDGHAVYYNIGGIRLTAPQKGVNIVKYPDGKTKKVTIR